MSVHYKFKAALDFSTVTFDGIHISVGDLKKEIIEQKRLGKNADFDLQIQNAQTKEVYQDEFTLIPKNTSVIVARVPVADKKRSTQGPGGGGGRDGGRFAAMQRNHLASLPPADLAKGVDLATLDMEEEEKIKAMMCQSTAEYDPSRYMKIRGSNQHGKVPDSYRCYKCNNAGHWIKNCPMISHDTVDVKKSTGIPRSFMVMVEGPEVPGALITPEGQYVVPAIDREAYSSSSKPAPEPVPKPKIPGELICPLCQDLLTDALLVPCCANSYCDECIRTALTESDDLVCPACGEKDTSPNELIPNRFLRTAVNAFRNETGYSKPYKIPERKEKEPLKEAQVAPIESRRVSLEDLPQDLFIHSPRKIDSVSSSDQVDSIRADDGGNSSDLYDFNDGSIPSPFAFQEKINSISTTVTSRKDPVSFVARDREAIEQNQLGSYNYREPPPFLPNQRGEYLPHPNNFRVPPPNYNKGPSPHHHHSHGPLLPLPYHPSREREPSPPGFRNIVPPGEETMQLSPKPCPPNSGTPPNQRVTGSRDDKEVGPPQPSPGGPPPLIQGLSPFMHTPPGYVPPPPGSIQRPPPGPGLPGAFPPDRYPPNFTRMPPPPGFPIYPMGPGPYPLMDIRYKDKGRDHDQERYRDREYRDDYDREREPPRRSYHSRERSGSERLRRRRSSEENRPGLIEDPLQEFEKLMREKDRRKQLMSGVLVKRSPTPTVSLPEYRNHSPNLRKRSRSRSRSRGPSFPRSPPQPTRRSRSPAQPTRRSRSPAHPSRRSRSPPQPSSRSRRPPLSHRRSRSPTQPNHRSRRLRDCRSRSPTHLAHRSSSPLPPARRSRSPKHHSRRSRSPKRHSRRSRSPKQPAARRSRSPPPPVHRSRSPKLPVRRSRTPIHAVHKSRSPPPIVRRSPSPPIPVQRMRSPLLPVQNSSSPVPPVLRPKSPSTLQPKKESKHHHHHHHRHRKSSGDKKAKKKKHKKEKKKDKEEKKKDKEEKKAKKRKKSKDE